MTSLVAFDRSRGPMAALCALSMFATGDIAASASETSPLEFGVDRSNMGT
jgi:hypothetical protein